MRFRLSKLVPVRMSTLYADGATGSLITASWWQWRRRCLRARHRATGFRTVLG